ncbi:MAG: winged helix-turn-helix transcriptional regulator [Candidatus Woesearchaeota archaeon]|jgi:DNA-binding Lrp family transcriptional regulator
MPNKYKIIRDKLDLKILAELDRNSRESYTEIGKRVKLSKQAVKIRMDKMVMDGVIDHFITCINIAGFGYVPYTIYLSLHNLSEAKKKEMINYLIGKGYINKVLIFDGQYDMELGIPARNPYELQQKLSEVYTNFSEQIRSNKRLLLVDTHFYPRSFLLNTKRLPLPLDKGFHRRNLLPPRIKETDLKILEFLDKDPRIPATQIAQKLKLPVQTIINRIRFMENNQVIMGYTMILNDTKYFMGHTILIEFSSIPEELERELVSFLSSHPNIVFVAKTFGEFDYLINIEYLNIQDYRNFVEEFKRRFYRNLKSFIPLLISNFPKMTFFPR